MTNEHHCSKCDGMLLFGVRHQCDLAGLVRIEVARQMGTHEPRWNQPPKPPNPVPNPSETEGDAWLVAAFALFAVALIAATVYIAVAL